MTTFIVLALMISVFVLVFHGVKTVWRRSRPELRKDTHQFMPGDQALDPDRLTDLLEEHRGGIPLRPLLLMSSLAMVTAVACGFAFLNLMYRGAPIQKVRKISAPLSTQPMPLPRVLRGDFVDSNKVRVIVDDSSPDAPVVEDLLRRCAAFEITYVTPEGTVKCYSEGSANAQILLNRTRLSDMECGVQQQGFGAVVTAATEAVTKEVSERKPGDRYAELVYFVLTFLGVFLRFCWEASKSVRGRRKTSPYFTPQTLITSLVLAIATYAMIIQSGLAGSSDLLSFKTGIFAMYNGILSTGLLRDFGTLRPVAATPATPAAPP